MMSKKKSNETKATTIVSGSCSVKKPIEVIFPTISPKEELECRTILKDQILVIDVSSAISLGQALMLIF